MSLREEAVGLLQTLIRLNTVNPPGNETIAAHALRDYLAAQGIECDLYARTPERASAERSNSLLATPMHATLDRDTPPA